MGSDRCLKLLEIATKALVLHLVATDLQREPTWRANQVLCRSEHLLSQASETLEGPYIPRTRTGSSSSLVCSHLTLATQIVRHHHAIVCSPFAERCWLTTLHCLALHAQSCVSTATMESFFYLFTALVINTNKARLDFFKKLLSLSLR